MPRRAKRAAAGGSVTAVRRVVHVAPLVLGSRKCRGAWWVKREKDRDCENLHSYLFGKLKLRLVTGRRLTFPTRQNCERAAVAAVEKNQNCQWHLRGLFLHRDRRRRLLRQRFRHGSIQLR